MNTYRLQWYYNTIMKRDFLYKLVPSHSKGNIQNLPVLEKISLNMGASTLNGTPQHNILGNQGKIIQILSGLELLSCQKVKKTYAKQSIASFKLRQGQCIGGMVTLRNENLFSFLERFCFITTPKRRDFQNIQVKPEKGQHQNRIHLQISGAPFLLYSELSNHYESFEGIQGFNVNINIQYTKPLNGKLFISFFLP